MKLFKKVIGAVIFAAMVCLPSSLMAGDHNGDNGDYKKYSQKGRYLAGDFHQHTYYTDGSYRFFDVMRSNVDYGLDWWANSEHGGYRHRDRNGNFWDDPAFYPVNPIVGDEKFRQQDGIDHLAMWRWQNLTYYVYPDILATRSLLPEYTIINGLEWNVPGHEHCSTAIYPFNNDPGLISEFEYRYDKDDDDTSRNDEESLLTGFGPLSKTNDNGDREDAIAAVEFMQAVKDQGLGDAWVVPAHIERAISYKVEDFRNWNNAGPDVAFGFEGAPGHQSSSERGFSRSADGGGTYGGSGWYSAEIGGLWDALLGEGRNWWNFASSDYHSHWTAGGGDFWPGEYQKNYTYIKTDNPDKLQAVFDGVRSGNSWHVEGDLIDSLYFVAEASRYGRKGKGDVAMMGQTLKVKAGQKVTIVVKAHDPYGENFCPFDMDNPSLAQVNIYEPLNKPLLRHIDLIGGEFTDYKDPEDSAAYTDASNPKAKVVKRYTARSKKGGWSTFEYTFRAKAGKNMYFRLRGTNMPAGVPNETDEQGNPLADSLANDNIYSLLENNVLQTLLIPGFEVTDNDQLDDVAEAYADLWFYSNPIFVKVVK